MFATDVLGGRNGSGESNGGRNLGRYVSDEKNLSEDISGPVSLGFHAILRSSQGVWRSVYSARE
jgi:hypothetical protein